MRITVATCNRADYSKLAPVLLALRDDPAFELSIVVMGSHLIDDYGNTFRFIEKDGLEIDSMLHTLVRGETEGAMVESMGLAMIKLPDVLNRLQPDLVVVHGDRFDAMSVAISAAVMNVRVVHLEGGEVSGTIDDVIRHSITKLSHYHICCNKAARQRIESMCEDANRVLVAGCPAYDQLLKVDPSQYQPAYDRFLPGHVGTRNYIVCVYHPVTTSIAESVEHYAELLDALLEFGVLTVILYPNVDAGSKELVRLIRMRQLETNPLFHCYKHVPFSDFVYLMANAGLMIGNSSAGIRESNVFGTPVINLGTRQQGRQCGANVSQLEQWKGKEPILELMRRQFGKSFPCDFLYGDGHAVERIIAFLSRIDKNSTVQKSFNFDRNQIRSRSKLGSGSFPLAKQWHSERLALAVDLGGSFLRVALVDDRGAIVNIIKTPMLKDAEARLNAIISHCKELINSHGHLIAGVGVSTGGRVNSETGEVMFATAVLDGWGGMQLKQRLQHALGLPCCVENDGNCAALAELHFGSQHPEMAFLHFGTGIGGGIIQDSCLLNGANYSSGEFGHMVVNFDGPECMCGSSGCVEAYAGGWALDKLAREAAANASSGDVTGSGTTGDDPVSPAKGSSLVKASLAGDQFAAKHVEAAVRAVESCVVSIYNAYDPQVVVLGGPLAPLYHERVSQRLAAGNSTARGISLELTSMVEMSLKGAATLVLHSVDSD